MNFQDEFNLFFIKLYIGLFQIKNIHPQASNYSFVRHSIMILAQDVYPPPSLTSVYQEIEIPTTTSLKIRKMFCQRHKESQFRGT